METKVIGCFLCSTVTETSSDMEVHILTKHADIFRSVSDDKKTDESVSDFPEKKKESTESTCREEEEFPEIMEIPEPKSEDGNTRPDLTTEIKFGLVIIEGKQCSKCDFLATDFTLMNDHQVSILSTFNVRFFVRKSFLAAFSSYVFGKQFVRKKHA